MRSELEVLLERLQIAVSDVSPESEHQLSDHLRLFPPVMPDPEIEEQRDWLTAVFDQVENGVSFVAPPPLQSKAASPADERQLRIDDVCRELCTKDHLRMALATEHVTRVTRLRLAIALTLDQSVENPDPADQVTMWKMRDETDVNNFLQFDPVEGGPIDRTWFSVLGLAPTDVVSFGPTSARQTSRLNTVTALARGEARPGPFTVQEFMQAVEDRIAAARRIDVTRRPDVDADQIIEATTNTRQEIEVRILANKVIELEGTVRIDRPFSELSKLVDPRMWGLASSFFEGSKVLRFDDGAVHGPAVGTSWSGSFSEVVMGKMFGVTNHLHVTFESNEVRAQCDYRLDEPANRYLATNKGYFGVQRCRDGRSGCEATLLKVIRWKDDAPGRYLRQHWSAFGLREWFTRQAIEFLAADVSTLARSVQTDVVASAIPAVPAQLAARRR